MLFVFLDGPVDLINVVLIFLASVFNISLLIFTCVPIYMCFVGELSKWAEYISFCHPIPLESHYIGKIMEKK